jgi:hypothetical protein
VDDLKFLQMSLDNESLKLDAKEKRLAETMNVLKTDMKDHRQYHQLLLELNGPIEEGVVLVQVPIKWNNIEEGEQAEVDFHPQCHHLKRKKPK